MSVLIRDMELPKSCIECKLLNWRPSKKHYRCPLTNEKIDDDTELSWGYLSKNCPLIKVNLKDFTGESIYDRGYEDGWDAAMRIGIEDARKRG